MKGHINSVALDLSIQLDLHFTQYRDRCISISYNHFTSLIISLKCMFLKTLYSLTTKFIQKGIMEHRSTLAKKCYWWGWVIIILQSSLMLWYVITAKILPFCQVDSVAPDQPAHCVVWSESYTVCWKISETQFYR